MNIENITPIERSGTEPKNPKLSVHEFIYREPKSDELKALSTTKNPVDTNFRILCTTKDYSEVKDSKKLWETNFVITPIPEGIDPNSEDISAHSFSGRTVRWKEGNSHTELNEKSIRKLPGIPLVGNGFTIGSDGISKGTTFWLAEDSLTEFASKLINSGMQKIETPVMKNEGEVIGPREHAKRTFLQGTIDINTESDIRSSAKEYLGALVNNDLRLLITGEIDFRAKIIELSKKILNEPISRLKIAKTFGSEKGVYPEPAEYGYVLVVGDTMLGYDSLQDALLDTEAFYMIVATLAAIEGSKDTISPVETNIEEDPFVVTKFSQSYGEVEENAFKAFAKGVFGIDITPDIMDEDYRYATGDGHLISSWIREDGTFEVFVFNAATSDQTGTYEIQAFDTSDKSIKFIETYSYDKNISDERKAIITGNWKKFSGEDIVVDFQHYHRADGLIYAFGSESGCRKLLEKIGFGRVEHSPNMGTWFFANKD